ncbi:MAG: DUF1343 domain-containing protein [Planctomycetes bacterium]|nr:DUF1343 domain-containing protein [Planctomycetota bacterium]
MSDAHASGSREAFALGLERALVAPPRRLELARRVGLLVNQASVDHAFRYAHESFAARFPGKLAALFGPQHGLWSEQQDNMIETAHARDARLRVPCHSLYAERREPSAAMLEGLDLFVVDLQDVGTRVYTYIWTLLLAMRACAAHRVPMLVLDRPNPLGGEVVEGPRLEPDQASFVGLLPIPMRHALTIGELARWFQREHVPDALVEVVPMQGWRRDTLWPELASPRAVRSWVPTSPNLPRFEGVLVYPGQVLLEGTNLSEGRGTTTPFEICGAPWLDGHELAAAMVALGSDPSIALRPVRFEPTFHKHIGRSCGGVFLHPHEPRRARSYRTTLALLAACRTLAPREFAWRKPPYEYETAKEPIDILSGSRALRLAIDAGADRAALDSLAAVDVSAWWDEVGDAVLYPRGT